MIDLSAQPFEVGKSGTCMEKRNLIKQLKAFWTISILILLSGCVAVFNNPDAGSTNTSSSTTASSSSSSDSVSFTAFTTTNRTGWLKRFSGTCSSNGTVVTFTDSGNQVSGSATCSSGTFEVYLDTSSLSVSTHTISASHGDASTTITINKISAACDDPDNRDNTYAGGMASGAGTEASPYVVCTADQLNQIGSGLSDYYILQNDIYFLNGDTNGDLVEDGSDTDYVSGNGWDPIGGTFAGLFNGNLFSIYDLTINRPTTDIVGLFATVDTASVHGGVMRLHLMDVDIQGQDKTAAAIGNFRSGLISKLRISGTIQCQAECGGAAGHASAYGSIDAVVIGNVYNEANITGSGNGVGGVVGNSYAGKGAYVWGSVNTGTIQGADRVGGITGLSGSNTGMSLMNSGTISGGDSIGGIIGHCGSATNLYKIYSSGSVTGSDYVGGLVGYRCSPDYSFATGTVSGNSAATQVGPIVGDANTFYNSYYYSGAPCTNSGGGGSCNATGTAVADLSDFYSPTNAPLSVWDFEGSWDSRSGDIWTTDENSLPRLWLLDGFEFTSSFSGSGTVGSPYQIGSLTDIEAIGSNPRYMDAHFELTTSLNMASIANFDPIAGDTIFSGTFDGGGNALSNLTISNTLGSRSDAVGFFGRLVHADFSDLTITGADIDSASTQSAGIAVGKTDGAVNISNISVAGTVDCTDTSVCGGAVGSLTGAAASDLSSSADVTGIGDVGGLIGDARGRTTLVDSYATGNVVGSGGGTTQTGGLSGYSYQITMNRVYATGSVTNSATGGNSAAGGLVGRAGGTPDTHLNCYATGDVNVTGSGDYAGGLIGRAGGDIDNCYATGDVTGNTYVGGFIGDSPKEIDNSFATGNVTGNDAADTVGLFVGDAAGGTFTNDYVSNTATCTNSGAGNCNTDYTGSQAPATFEDPSNAPMNGVWDFGSIWQDNSGTPALPTLQ